MFLVFSSLRLADAPRLPKRLSRPSGDSPGGSQDNPKRPQNGSGGPHDSPRGVQEARESSEKASRGTHEGDQEIENHIFYPDEAPEAPKTAPRGCLLYTSPSPRDRSLS
eukprot:1877775-Pyramimonas_sp.AAC.1